MNINADISIIVCCYNPDIQKLKYTLNSIYNQKDVNFEVIISDDGSKTEYKEEIVKWINNMEYKNCKFNFLHQNVGTIKNIISAIECSSAKYVKTISPGDYFYNEYSLSKYLKAFETENADIIFGRAVYYSGEDIISSMSPQNPTILNNKGLFRKVVIYHDFILGATIAAKKEVELKYLNLIKDCMKYLEDVPLTNLALIDKKKVFAIADNLIWYEYGLGISTNSNSSNLLDSDYNNFFNFIKEYYKNDKKIIMAIKFYYMNCNKTLKYIRKTLLSPMYVVHCIQKILFKKKKNNKNIDIQEMKKIINYME